MTPNVAETLTVAKDVSSAQLGLVWPRGVGGDLKVAATFGSAEAAGR
jgi:hypothetical protein